MTTVFRPVDTTPRQPPVFGAGPAVEPWWCPVCAVPAPRIAHQPGRPRIYCSPACRREMYRMVGELAELERQRDETEALVKSAHNEHWRGDARGRRPDAAAKSQHVKLDRPWRDDFC